MANVPEIYENHKLYKDILKYHTFKNIPSTFKNIEFCKVAIDIDVNNILHVSPRCLEIDKYFLEKFNNLLFEIPQELQTSELCLMAVKKDFENNFNDVANKFQNQVYRAVLIEQYNGSLESFPRELINKTLIKVAVDIDINNLKYVPYMLLTDDVYRFALQVYDNSLEKFPKELLTKSLAEIAVRVNPGNLQYYPYKNSLKIFPTEFITQGIAEAAVKLDPYNLNIIYQSNKGFNFDKIHEAALKVYNNSLDRFPRELLTQDIAEAAVKLDPYNLNIIYQSKERLNFDKIHTATLQAYDNSLEKFPKELLRQGIAAVAVKLDINNLKYLSDENMKAFIHYAIHNNSAKALEFWLDTMQKQYTQEASLLIDNYINARDNKGNTQLIYSAKAENKDVIEVLIKYGAEIDVQGEDGMTALHWLAKSGHLEPFKLLVNHGANPNIIDYTHGRTALHFAAAGSLDIVKYLIEKNPNIINCIASKSKATALHYAADSGKLEIVKYLVEQGSDMNMPGPGNRTALYCATEKGYLNIVKYLVEKGSDINVLGPRENTLIDCANQNGYSDIVDYLEKQKRDVDVLNDNQKTPVMLDDKGSNQEIMVTESHNVLHAGDNRQYLMDNNNSNVELVGGGVKSPNIGSLGENI
ncbi:MAG: ankyrin repeat domain-containing protein [Rickettsia endosymbiont of Ixodes persulcatus]|nr:ankyrin repeat domain-containing protein [Rickettsia endosymbiont of Ixodes persulcatus]MCZ6919031.1 ankyrin repeat domain-containing protein [Rickettsia endosymbiont of Ixodes persulcatus]